MNQLLPEIVRFAFPKLAGVDIIAERADTDGSFTDHDYGEGTCTLLVCDELQDAPISVMAGAIAMELQQIEKEVRMPIRYKYQRLLEKLSGRYAAHVSRKEDLDLVSRGLGGNYSEFNKFISNHCVYAWDPLDGYSPAEFEMLLGASDPYKRYLTFS